ncbi:hypothetical protein LTR36_010879, partial [Oleoguttula mirabilis]
MDGWDNLSNDWVIERDEFVSSAYSSSETCEAYCRKRQETCLQWAWRPGLCRGGKAVRLGWALDNRPALGSAEDKIAIVEGEESK